MESLLGSITCIAGSKVPKGWVSCDGQELHVSEFTALFSIIGTRFGGDGRYIFKLPDLRGRAPVSAGQSPFSEYELGDTAGTESASLRLDNLPAHTHNGNIQLKLPAMTDPGIDPTVNDGYPAEFTGAYATSGGKYMAGPQYSADMKQMSDGTPVNTRSPYLVLQYIICIIGVHPVRS